MTTIDRARKVVEAVPKDLLIGGKWTSATGAATFPVENPADGQVLCAVADATAADGVAALDAAVEAQPAWAARSPRERGEILRAAFELLMERREDLLDGRTSTGPTSCFITRSDSCRRRWPRERNSLNIQ